jgi:hypothetical protein
MERAWEDDERLRQWRNATTRVPNPTALRREPDHRITERVIGSRNEYYMATIRGNRLPTIKHSVSPMRWIPNEMHRQAKPAPSNVFYWGI